MLRVNQSTSAERAKGYYTDGLSRDDSEARLPSREGVGKWRGKGAERLGLTGTVDRDFFFDLAENRRPDTDDPLTLRTKGNRRVGYDFTFSVPKSVSVVHALSGDEGILRAFEESVGETMAEIERAMATRVRRGDDWDKNKDRVTGNMLWAEFTHFTSRPVDGTPDPHLHAHAFTFNVTYDDAEKRWKAGQFGGIKRDARYYEAAFEARMAAKLEALGYRTKRNAKKGWELEGIPESVIRKFSRRGEEVEKLAESLGVTDPEAKHRLAEKTRRKKSRELDEEGLKTSWDARLDDAEREAMKRVFAKEARRPSRAERMTAKEALDYAFEHLLERRSVVGEKQLLDEALRRGVGKVTVEAVKEELASRTDVLRKEDEKGLVWLSTKDVLKEEESLLRFVREGKNAERPLMVIPLGRDALDNVVVDKEGSRLTADQKAAIMHVLTSRDRVIAVRGGAGTGKTSMMKEAVGGILYTGRKKVIVLAPTRSAVHTLREERRFQDAHTVSRFLVDKKLQKATKGQVIWVDEAGLLGARDLGRVFKIAERKKARVVLCGDTRQHGSVARGDALRLVEERAGIKAAELTTIKRQRDPGYREAAETIANGHIAAGLDKLDALGMVHACGVEEERHKLYIANYLDLLEKKKTVLGVAPTHKEGKAVTAGLRAELKAKGKLGQEREFVRLVDRSLSVAEKRDAKSYEPGNVIEVHGKMWGFHRGERLTVERIDQAGRVIVRRHKDPPLGIPRVPGVPGRAVLPLSRGEKFDVYREDRITLAVGDTIRISRKGKTANQPPTLKGKRKGKGRKRSDTARDTKKGKPRKMHEIESGTIARVKGFTWGGRKGDRFRNGHIVLSTGQVLLRDFGHIDHGYVVTSHFSQSKSVDTVLLAQSSESYGAASREQWYVSVTRGRDAVHVYTDDTPKLKEAIERSSHRMFASDLVEPQHGEARPSDAATRAGTERSTRERQEEVERRAAHAERHEQERKAAEKKSPPRERAREQPELVR